MGDGLQPDLPDRTSVHGRLRGRIQRVLAWREPAHPDRAQRSGEVGARRYRTEPLPLRGAYPASYTPGTLGRNTLQAPGIVWGQASLSKEWPIRERLRFNLRFDVNNVYKYHNFNAPNATYNAADPSSFGTFGGTRGSFSDIGTGRWHGIMVFRVMW